MAIDVFNDGLLNKKDVVKKLSGRPHQQTVQRWMTKGRKGVVLESVIIDNCRYTTEASINSFLEKTSRARN